MHVLHQKFRLAQQLKHRDPLGLAQFIAPSPRYFKRAASASSGTGLVSWNFQPKEHPVFGETGTLFSS